jgi:hypothetical protein
MDYVISSQAIENGHLKVVDGNQPFAIGNNVLEDCERIEVIKRSYTLLKMTDLGSGYGSANGVPNVGEIAVQGGTRNIVGSEGRRLARVMPPSAHSLFAISQLLAQYHGGRI